MRYEGKCVVFGRKPRKAEGQYKTAFFKIYKEVNPLKNNNGDVFPDKELDFPDTEKVEIRNFDVDYYLEGNDLVIDDIKAIDIEQEGNIISLKIEK
ncbi:MAG: hypothetical protein ACQER9_01085 [Nanobdellota archaeon]